MLNNEGSYLECDFGCDSRDEFPLIRQIPFQSQTISFTSQIDQFEQNLHAWVGQFVRLSDYVSGCRI